MSSPSHRSLCKPKLAHTHTHTANVREVCNTDLHSDECVCGFIVATTVHFFIEVGDGCAPEGRQTAATDSHEGDGQQGDLERPGCARPHFRRARAQTDLPEDGWQRAGLASACRRHQAHIVLGRCGSMSEERTVAAPLRVEVPFCDRESTPFILHAPQPTATKNEARDEGFYLHV